MPDNRHELIAALNSSRNYCTYASGFLDYLGQRGVSIAGVIDVQVEQYLQHAIVLFESSVVDDPARAGTRFRAPEFEACCG